MKNNITMVRLPLQLPFNYIFFNSEVETGIHTFLSEDIKWQINVGVRMECFYLSCAVHCKGAAGAPEQWKWTLSHLLSRRCHTRVSSDWQLRGRLWLSMYCVRRIYAIQAASSPMRWTWGLRIVVCTGLLFLLSTEKVKRMDCIWIPIYIW